MLFILTKLKKIRIHCRTHKCILILGQLYIPTSAFLDYCAPINVDVFVEYGSYVSCRLFPSCHDGSGLSVLIQSHYLLLAIFAPLKKQA